ncbi:MAG TPA: hypothetical protein DDY89_07620 [Lysinibacillus sp.]|nr:hypothetical protein [Lysinibacillus sp.]
MSILAATGMRRGEAGGLRWSDIDFNRTCLCHVLLLACSISF